MAEVYFVEISEFWPKTPELSTTYVNKEYTGFEYRPVCYDSRLKAINKFKECWIELYHEAKNLLKNVSATYDPTPVDGPKEGTWYEVATSDYYGCAVRITSMLVM